MGKKQKVGRRASQHPEITQLDGMHPSQHRKSPPDLLIGGDWLWFSGSPPSRRSTLDPLDLLIQWHPDRTYRGSTPYLVLGWGQRKVPMWQKACDSVVGEPATDQLQHNTSVPGYITWLWRMSSQSSSVFPLGGRGLMSQHSSLGLKDALIKSSLILTNLQPAGMGR